MSLRQWVVAMCVATVAVPCSARAAPDPDPQTGDEAIPYDGEEQPDDSPAAKAAVKKNKKKRARSDDRLREDDEEARESLTHLDDPNVGLGVETFAGVMLLESSRGAGVNPLFSFGARATWEFGRLIPDEYVREMLFIDFQWQLAQSSDGTTEVHASSVQHYFTAAPAFSLPIGGPKSPIAAYVQLGAGANVNFSSIVVDRVETPTIGTKFLFQYGIGLRGRPAVLESGKLRVSFRIELTRFLRGYMSDTFVGGGVGLVF